MKHIGIIPNKLKDTDLKVTERIAAWFNQNHLSAYTTPDIAIHLESHTIAVSETELYEICDSLIVIGGDGTILSVAEAASMKNIPIVDIFLHPFYRLTKFLFCEIASKMGLTLGGLSFCGHLICYKC